MKVKIRNISIFFVIVSALSVLNLISCSHEVCSRYSCKINAGGNKNTCSRFSISEEDGIGEFSLIQGENKEDFACNIKSYEDEHIWTEKPLPVLFPQNACPNGKNYQCVFGSECKNESCSLISTPTCSNTGECPVSQACIKNEKGDYTCANQIAIGQPCENSTQCINKAFCGSVKPDKTEATCTELFSIKDGETAPAQVDTFFMSVDYASFCTSGFSVNGKCRSLALKDEDKPCQEDKDCEYSYKENNEEVKAVLKDSCQCSRNKEGNKFCRIPNMREVKEIYPDFIEKSIKPLLNNIACHSMQRFDCLPLTIDNNNLENLAIYNEFHSKVLDVAHSHRFKNSQNCVKRFLFPNYNPSKCPKYICDESPKEQVCLYSNNILSQSREIIAEPCEFGLECEVEKDKLNTNGEVRSACVNKNIEEDDSLYPGESCHRSQACKKVEVKQGQDFNSIKKCDSQSTKCLGAKEGEFCRNTDSCESGLFCNTKNTCTKLIGDGSKCTSHFECINTHFCNLEGNCSPMFSLKLGTNIKNYDDEIKNYLCESDYIYNNKCAEKYYDKRYTPNDGIVACDNFSYCFYSIKTGSQQFSTVYEECVCHYSETQGSICPYAFHDTGNSKWTKDLVEIKKKNLNNSKHTLNRFKGYTDDKHSNKCYSYYQDSAFAFAPDCIKKTFGYDLCVDLIDRTESSSEEQTDDSSTSLSLNKVLLLLFTCMLFN